MGIDTRATVRTLLIDADDTLWEGNIYYLQCTARLGDLLAPHGFTHERVEQMLHAVERETIPVHGYSPTGYITALGMTCERLLAEKGITASAEQVVTARACGDLVLSPPMVLLDRVEATLAALRPSSELILVTKGDDAFQRAKLARSGLEGYFDAAHVVAEKHPGIYRDIAEQHSLDKEQTWMVGNSPKSDINPAIAAGLGAIYIPHSQTWVAERGELEHPDAVITLERFSDLPAWFGLEN